MWFIHSQSVETICHLLCRVPSETGEVRTRLLKSPHLFPLGFSPASATEENRERLCLARTAGKWQVETKTHHTDGRSWPFEIK